MGKCIALRPDAHRRLMTVRLTWRMLRDNLVLSLMSFVSPSDRDRFLRPTLEYRHSDRLRISAGANVFGGRHRHTFYGQFRDDSSVFARVRWSFQECPCSRPKPEPRPCKPVAAIRRSDRYMEDKTMTSNVGTQDRIIRVVLGVVLIGATLAGAIGPWGWIGIVPLATGAIGFCPAYRLFGLNSCSTRTRD